MLIDNQRIKKSKLVGRNLRYLRKLFGITQEELAEILDITNSAISQYERGRNIPPTLMSFKICQHFKLPDISYLVDKDLKTESWQPNNSVPDKAAALDRLSHFDTYTDELIKTIIGKNIRYLRKLFNVTQEELAETLGTSNTSISKYESNSNIPSVMISYKLCQFFKLPDISYLLDKDLAKEGWNPLTSASEVPNKVAALNRLAHFETYANELTSALERLKKEIVVFKQELERVDE